VQWIGGHEAYDAEYVKARFVRGNERPWKDADLTGSGVRHGETGEVWRGFDVTAKGRHWAYQPRELDKLDEAGTIYWPEKKSGWPRFKKYLDDAKGVPLRALATLPTAFLAGAGGTLGLRAFEGWAYAHSIHFTSQVNLVSYMGLFMAPFVLFVIGIDPRRWEDNYRLSPGFKADYRRVLIRWAVYTLGTFMVAYVF
jgi:hypothetical protein